ncbi:Protein of unknown function [Bacillus cereus]|uniref:Uncharacterized protein n=1 Tax=Bacillus wiedmannii TaxID=1890302 RepID=A0AB37YSN8_9BACI|nr:Protein of unknown function [Bacillus wiedmannii]SCN44763.1 Protein of unknown function [Bacillus cereus]
MVKARKLAF